MEPRLSGNEFRTTIVCIDEYDYHGAVAGRLYHPYLEEGKKFGSLMEFLYAVDQLLDDIQLPQSFAQPRAFIPAAQHRLIVPVEQEKREGKKATFALRVIFRQNASWQGSITWLEGNREEHFRSALELIHLVGSVLAEEQQQDEEETRSG